MDVIDKDEIPSQAASDLVGFIDNFDGRVLQGWAGSLADPSSETVIAVSRGGRIFGTSVTGLHREDVLAASGLSNAGFSLELADWGEEPFTVLAGRPSELGTWTCIADHLLPSPVIGYIDTIRGHIVRGWALSTGRRSHLTPRIELRCGSRVVAFTMPELERPDVAALYHLHESIAGFEIMAPWRLMFDGPFEVDVYGIVESHEFIIAEGISMEVDVSKSNCVHYEFDHKSFSWHS